MGIIAHHGPREQPDLRGTRSRARAPRRRTRAGGRSPAGNSPGGRRRGHRQDPAGERVRGGRPNIRRAGHDRGLPPARRDRAPVRAVRRRPAAGAPFIAARAPRRPYWARAAGAVTPASRPWLATAPTGRRERSSTPARHRRACSRSCSACSGASRRRRRWSSSSRICTGPTHRRATSSASWCAMRVTPDSSSSAPTAPTSCIGAIPCARCWRSSGASRASTTWSWVRSAPASLRTSWPGSPGEAPNPELVSAVLSRSGGNPFFVEELMAAGEGGLALPAASATRSTNASASRRRRPARAARRIGRRRARGPSSPGRGCGAHGADVDGGAAPGGGAPPPRSDPAGGGSWLPLPPRPGAGGGLRGAAPQRAHAAACRPRPGPRAPHARGPA